MVWNNATAIATLAVTDLNEARRFYGDKVGLNEAGELMPGQSTHVLFQCGNAYLCVYERPEPSGSKATTCALEVDDVESTVERLRNNGVRFEEYDIPEMGIKTRNGIASTDEGLKSAWFKDPWGNILSIDNALTVATKQGQVEPIAR